MAAPMGNKQKGAKHLTELTLGIDGIRQALEEAQKMVEEKSKELGKQFAENFSKQASESAAKVNLGVTSEEAEKVGKAISALQGDYGRLVQVIKDVNAAGEETKRTSVFEGEDGKQKKIVQSIVDGEELITFQYKDNIKKREEAEQKLFDRRVSNMRKSVQKFKEAKEAERKTEIQEIAKRRTYEEQVEKERVEAARKQADEWAGINEEKTRNQQQMADMLDRMAKKADAEHQKEIKRIAAERDAEKEVAKQKAESAQDYYNSISGVGGNNRASQKELFEMSQRLTKQEAEREKSKEKAHQLEIQRIADERTYREREEDSIIESNRKRINSFAGINEERTRSEQQMADMADRMARRAEAEHKKEIDRIAAERNENKKAAEEKAKYEQERFNRVSGIREAETLSRKEQIEMEERFTRREEAKEKAVAAAEEKRAGQARAALDKALKERDAYYQAEEQKAKADALAYEKQVDALDKLIRKQREFTATVGKQKNTSANRELIKQSNELEDSIKRQKAELLQSGKASDEVAEATRRLSNAQQELGTEFKVTGAQGVSAYTKIAEKTKELTIYYAVIKAKQALSDTVVTVKETEDAVVQLQRVLNEDIGGSALSKELYDIAYNYGRDFADVQDAAVKFAQTGASWEDTVKLTKSAMLALNTAELDVQQSTEGLIAIMSQWNIEAEDMEETIDKINITADSFPITSEKIISALQRASGSARQAKLNFEETIGAITALGKATGRSGEVIGTALNSLLIYTSKPKALETFYEVGNETVRKTVDAYRTGAADILDVWKALSSQLNALNGEQKELLAGQLYEGMNGEDFAQHLEEHASVITDDIKKIYGTAGTFRQNYLVALLNDIGTIDEVTTNMTNSIGYSVQENEKYMGTLSAKSEQLASVWKGLVVEMDESNVGFMALTKGLADAGIGVGNLIKMLGGLNGPLSLIWSHIIKIKSQKINETMLPALNGKLDALKLRLEGTRAETILFSNSVGGLGKAFDYAKAAAAGFTMFLSKALAAAAAFSFVEGTISNAVAKKREAEDKERDASISAKEAILEQSESTEKLYNDFVRLSEASGRTKEEQRDFERSAYDLADALRIQAVNSDGTVKSFEELAQAIIAAKDAADSLTDAEWDEYLNDLNEKLEISSKKDWFFGIKANDVEIQGREILKIATETKDKLLEIMEPIMQSDTDGKLFFAPGEGGVKEFYEVAAAARDYLKEVDKTRKLTEEEQEAFESLGDEMSKVKETYEAYMGALVRRKVDTENVTTATLDSADAFNKFKEEVYELAGGGAGLENFLDGLINDLVPGLNENLVETSHVFELSEDEAKALETAMKDLNSEIDTSQSAFDGVHNAIEEFNENGYISVDTIQKLTAGGYDFIKAMDFSADSIKLADDAEESLVNTQKENVLQSIKLAAAMDALNFTEAYLKGQTDGNTISNEELTGSLVGVNKEMADAIINSFGLAEGYNKAAQEAAKLAGKSAPDNFDADAFQSALADRLKGWSDYYSYVEKGIGSIEQYSNKAVKDREKAEREAAQAAKKNLNAQKKAINEKYKDEKDRLEEQKKAVKERYKTEIDALKEAEKELDRKDKLEDYIKRKNEAAKDVAQAQARSGVEYREKEAEALEKQAELEKDWNKEQQKWATEDKIKALEALRDAEVKNIDAQIKASEKLKERELKAIESKIAALDNVKSVAEEAYEDMAETAVESSEEASKEVAENVKQNAAEPIKQNANATIEDLAKQIRDAQVSIGKNMENAATYNAKQIRNIYKRELIAPLAKDLNGLQMRMALMRPGIPMVSAFGTSYSEPAPASNQTSNYNYNNTSTNFYNIANENAARGLRDSSIFTKP